MNEARQRSTAAEWLRRGIAAIEVQVDAVRGSVPRGAGTRMLVSADAVLGTIGGGHLEWRAIADARRLLAEGGLAERPVRQSIALGPTLGQCCGGALTLVFSAFDASALARWPAPPPLFTLQLYGAGHVGRAIVRLLEGLDCRVQWIDERESEFPAEATAAHESTKGSSRVDPSTAGDGWPLAPPGGAHVERLCVEPVEAEVPAAPPGCFYLVLTHSHELDLRITEAILKRGDFGYLGLIGSATKRARFLHRFEQRGIAADTLARMTCPIGVPGIGGKQPEVIAIAVVAQLLQRAEAAAAAPVSG